MPPKDSIIPSPWARSAVIAGAMWALLAGSLLLSWGLTGAPLKPPGSPITQWVEIAGATLGLPGSWALESEVSQEDSPILQWTFVNQSSSAERLRVVRFSSTQPADPGLVLGEFVLPRLIAGRQMKMQRDTPLYRFDRQTTGQGEAIDMVFTTQRLARVSTSPQLHAVRLLSPDGKNFWVFQLTDQVAEEHWNRDLEVLQMEQLRSLLAAFEYDS
ncbi:MAG: hypothetical protein AAF911_11905 [Planctomycetota bacterium]